MKYLVFAGCFTIFSFTFFSCNVCSCKKVPCPAFEDVNFQTWFASYQSAQQSIYKYQSSFDTITLASPIKNETYEASQGCIGANQGCSMNYSAESYEISATLRRKLSLNYFGAPSQKSISIWVMGFDCYANDVNNQGLVPVSGVYTGSFSSSLTLDGKTFNNVQVIMRDTTTNHFIDQPYKIYLSKGPGLIAYEMYPGLQLWVKQ